MAEADPQAIGAVLAREWPDAACELLARDPFELLIAAILSARATDHQVNAVMALLAEHHVGVAAYAQRQPEALEPFVRHLPLWRQKARSVVECAQALLRHHGGVVPEDPELLARLPGVGRKVAAVVAGNAFGVPAVAADTHVCRLALRFGWIDEERPLAAEQAIRDRFAPERWVRLCHQLIRLGRTHCRRAQARCAGCPCVAICPRQGVGDATA